MVTTVFERKLLLTVPKNRGLTMPCRATMGENQGLQEAEVGGKHGHEPLLWFLQEEMGKAGEAS